MSDLAEKVERAVVYTPQPGDVVVLEVAHPLSLATIDTLKAQAREAFGSEVRLAVLSTGMRFGGVVRGEGKSA